MAAGRGQENRGRGAAEAGDENGKGTLPAMRGGHPAFRARRSQGITEAGGAAQHQPLETPGDRRKVSAEEALYRPERHQVRPRAHGSPTQGTEEDEGRPPEGTNED